MWVVSLGDVLPSLLKCGTYMWTVGKTHDYLPCYGYDSKILLVLSPSFTCLSESSSAQSQADT